MARAGAGRRAGQGGYGGLAHRDQRAGQRRLPPAQVAQPLLEGHLAARTAAAHALDVAAAAEGGAGAGDQDGADVRVLAALADLAAQRRGELVRHGVARLGPVQRDQRHAVADRAQKFGCAGIDFHGSLRAMTFPVTEHTVKTARHTTGYLACGAEKGPLLIFCHGWPRALAVVAAPACRPWRRWASAAWRPTCAATAARAPTRAMRTSARS